MKKVVLFVAVLMFAGAVAVSAQTPEPKLDVALAGNASFTFGINLDASLPQDATNSNGTTKRIVATGIENAFENKATLTILAAADYEKGGKEGEEVYGWIKLKNISISGSIDNTSNAGLNNGDDDVTSGVNVAVRNVEAKLFLGPVYVNVLGADNEVDKAGSLTELFVATTSNVETNPSEQYRGFSVGLKDESVISLAVGLASRSTFAADGFDLGDSGKAIYLDAVTEVPGGHVYVDVQTGTAYAAGTDAPIGFFIDYYGYEAANNANYFNDYNFYAALALKAIPDLTLEASVVTGKVTDDNAVDSVGTFGFGAKAGYGIGLAEGIKLTPYVAFDYSNVGTVVSGTTGTVTSIQFAGGVNLSVPGSKLDDWDTLGTEVDIDPGLTSIISYQTVNDSTLTEQADPNIDLGVYFYDADLIPVLNLVAALEIGDLTADTSQTGAETSTMGWGVYVEAVLDQLKPWAKYYTETETAYDAVEDAVVAEVTVQTLAFGVDITVITNTTFSISYENSGLYKHLSDADRTANADIGTIKFTTKISY